jgi:outer membrane scaffolding protein for murein synthesis (MipA/OmpV family)
MIFTYPVDDFGLFAGFRHYLYDSEVKNSPLTKSNDITQAFFGVGYQF